MAGRIVVRGALHILTTVSHIRTLFRTPQPITAVPPIPEEEMKPVLRRLYHHRPVHATHRGGRSSYAPENTMYGYKKSVYEDHTQILEFDVQITKDGVLVLHHDGTVESTTDGKGHVADFTLEQIKQFDSGYRFTQDGGKTFPLRGKGLTIPTLEELLDEFVQKEDLVFFFDMKSAAAIPATLESIQQRKIQDRVIFGAVSPSINQELRKQKPDSIPIAADAQTMLSVYFAFCSGQLESFVFQHDIMGFMVNGSTLQMISQPLFEALHAKGKWIALFGEGLNEPDVITTMLSYQTDIVMSDMPNVLRETIQQSLPEVQLSQVEME